MLPFPLFACALCSLYTPSATVEIVLEGIPTSIESAQFKWKFSKDFVDTLLVKYDKNNNHKLDSAELKLVQNILEKYISKKNYLTSIEYVSALTKEAVVKKLPINIIDRAFWQDENGLVFLYTISLLQEVAHNDELCFIVKDSEGYFNFLIHSIQSKTDEPFSLESNLYNDIAFIKIVSHASFEANETLAPQATIVPVHIPTAIQTEEALSPVSWIQAHLARMQEGIQEAITALKKRPALQHMHSSSEHHFYMAYCTPRGLGMEKRS